MLDARWVAENLEETAAALGRRSPALPALLEPIAALAQRRRAAIMALEGKQQERNRGSEAMAKARQEVARVRREARRAEGELSAA
jgi:seryl-tRNA synthetase